MSRAGLGGGRGHLGPRAGRMPPDRSVLMSRGLVLALLAAGCNEYPLFRVTGFEQAAYNNNADILFVIDNSGSMRDNTTQLALNFDHFIGQLASTTGSDVPSATLGDAVSNYLRETGAGSAIIDYQLAVTTTSADDGGNPMEGYGGLLLATRRSSSAEKATSSRSSSRTSSATPSTGTTTTSPPTRTTRSTRTGRAPSPAARSAASTSSACVPRVGTSGRAPAPRRASRPPWTRSAAQPWSPRRSATSSERPGTSPSRRAPRARTTGSCGRARTPSS